MLFAADGDDDLVEVPDIAAARFLALQAAGIIAPELHRPPSPRLVGDDNAALQQYLLDQAKAQREAKVQPHRMRDDRRRKPMALVADGAGSHGGDLHGPCHVGVNVTSPDIRSPGSCGWWRDGASGVTGAGFVTL